MQQPKNIQIQTITPLYDRWEDRIRLSINYQDLENRIDLMITRSFILQMIPAIEEYIYKHYSESINKDSVTHIEASYELKEEDIQNTQSFSHTNIEDLELYRSLEDLLITINLSYDKTTQNTNLQFISKEKHNCAISVSFDILQNILNSIKSSLPKIAWGIGYI